jgi:hypothetical protein
MPLAAGKRALDRAVALDLRPHLIEIVSSVCAVHPPGVARRNEQYAASYEAALREWELARSVSRALARAPDEEALHGLGRLLSTFDRVHDEFHTSSRVSLTPLRFVELVASGYVELGCARSG